MTITIGAVEMRKNLGRFLNLVLLSGDDVVIERDGKPVARLGPVVDSGRGGAGRLDLRKIRGLGSDVWRKVDADEYIRNERGSWA
jgi:antitoxin (DNA-binding transcriptional repressor) of toxin-antitoxin stability system